MAKPDMGDLHRDRHARDQHNLMAPVELISLARRIVERDIGLGGRSAALLRPGPGKAANRIIATLVTQTPKLFEDPDQGKPFP